MDGADMTPVGRTSRWVAANRAVETDHPGRLFADPYARPLAGDDGFALLEVSRRAKPGPPDGGPDPYLSIRTRFFDDALVRALADRRLGQVVLLAAGMDARAFRLAWPDGVTVYEVDRPEVFAHKEAVLGRLGAGPACARRVVPADLAGDWAGPLAAAGFDPARPAAFLAEGLLVYLEGAAVESLLAGLRGVAATGSWLGLDAVSTDLLTSPYLRPFLDEMDRLGCPWRFGTSDPAGLLAGYGWAAAVVQPGEPAANYGRWPYPVAPRQMAGIPRSYLVTAGREDGGR